MEYASDFFKEVLLSYRLLFGENKKSHRAFSKCIPQWQEEWNSGPVERKPPDDRLLLALGSQSWESDELKDVWNEIAAGDPAPYYSPTSDFKFLGRRLIELQNHVSDHSPQSFVALWDDTRNMQSWWTFWVRMNYLVRSS